jgi:outer membrane receptor protein involved in Fe transport
VNAFLGGSITYVDKTTATFPANGVVNILPAYALIDLRAGIAAPDGGWRVQLWGRNILNKYYLTTDTSSVDSTYRYAGMPATYGVTLTYRLH